MEFGTFAYKRNSANIAYYTETDGLHWVSVLETALDFSVSPPSQLKVSEYRFTVYKEGVGIVKEFSYTPNPRKVGGKDYTIHGNLDPVVVTNVMRREFDERPV